MNFTWTLVEKLRCDYWNEVRIQLNTCCTSTVPYILVPCCTVRIRHSTSTSTVQYEYQSKLVVDDEECWWTTKTATPQGQRHNLLEYDTGTFLNTRRLQLQQHVVLLLGSWFDYLLVVPFAATRRRQRIASSGDEKHGRSHSICRRYFGIPQVAQ